MGAMTRLAYIIPQLMVLGNKVDILKKAKLGKYRDKDGSIEYEAKFSPEMLDCNTDLIVP